MNANMSEPTFFVWIEYKMGDACALFLILIIYLTINTNTLRFYLTKPNSSYRSHRMKRRKKIEFEATVQFYSTENCSVFFSWFLRHTYFICIFYKHLRTRKKSKRLPESIIIIIIIVVGFTHTRVRWHNLSE
jgi:hypothetical protein